MESDDWLHSLMSQVYLVGPLVWVQKWCVGPGSMEDLRQLKSALKFFDSAGTFWSEGCKALHALPEI